MRRFILLPLMILIIASLAGCAALHEIISDIPDTNATAEIGAVETIAGDYLKEPYRSGVVLGIGYALALLRRWYKKKQGAKDV